MHTTLLAIPLLASGCFLAPAHAAVPGPATRTSAEAELYPTPRQPPSSAARPTLP